MGDVKRLDVHTEYGTLPKSSHNVLVIAELLVRFTIKQDASLTVVRNSLSLLKGSVITQNLKNIEDLYFVAVASNADLHSSIKLPLSNAKTQTNEPPSIVFLN